MGKFEKGHKGAKPKGALNKTTRSVKEAFTIAFENLQNDPATKLEVWGKKNTTEFYKLCSKLIPISADINAKMEVKQVFKIGDTEIEL